jgi:hypothetical protein
VLAVAVAEVLAVAEAVVAVVVAVVVVVDAVVVVAVEVAVVVVLAAVEVVAAAGVVVVVALVVVAVQAIDWEGWSVDVDVVIGEVETDGEGSVEGVFVGVVMGACGGDDVAGAEDPVVVEARARFVPDKPYLAA